MKNLKNIDSDAGPRIFRRLPWRIWFSANPYINAIAHHSGKYNMSSVKQTPPCLSWFCVCPSRDNKNVLHDSCRWFPHFPAMRRAVLATSSASVAIATALVAHRHFTSPSVARTSSYSTTLTSPSPTRTSIPSSWNLEYSQTKLLGRGTYGTVVRAKDSSTDKMFALKIVGNNLEQIKEEVDALKKVSHPALVRFVF